MRHVRKICVDDEHYKAVQYVLYTYKDAGNYKGKRSEMGGCKLLHSLQIVFSPYYGYIYMNSMHCLTIVTCDGEGTSVNLDMLRVLLHLYL